MFDPHSGQWRLLTPLLTPNRGSLVAVRRGKHMLAIGGGEPSDYRGRPIASVRVDALRIDHPDHLAAAIGRRLIG